jgi:non-heme chloroperoxidase
VTTSVRQGMMGGLKGQLDSIRAFSESDFHQDLKAFDKPTLVLHGDDDQIVPDHASARFPPSRSSSIPC